MPLQAAYIRDDGTPNAPGEDSPWSDWVAASKTRNYCCNDPLLDWLDAFGESKGFRSDDQRPGYDRRTDFRAFVFERAAQFERTVIDYLANRFQVVWVALESRDIQSRACVEATWGAMHAGVEIIAQGVLWNAETQTYGAPDLLVRSDILHRLFPDDISAADAHRSTSDLPRASLHYRVVDVKFTTLDLLRHGIAGSSHLHHMAQVWLYDVALARLQGLAPRAAFLLGRRWKNSKGRGQSALERLARVNTDKDFQSRELDLRELALNACDWIRRVRAKGSEWEVLPEPSVPELRPNMRHGDDQPWHHAKAEVARQLKDLTLLPRVTPHRRSQAFAAGITQWTDAQCRAAVLGITGDKHPTVLDAVISANQSDGGGSIVFPVRLTTNQACWREPVPAEFYVDFETVSDLDDDFATFPDAGGQPLIFMIGCAQMSSDSQWSHRTFTARSLTLAEERRIIEEWLEHLRHVCKRVGVSLDQARLFHWSPAETSFLTESYNAAVVRQGVTNWPALPWVDLLGRVMRKEPVTVRGAFGFGLKAIAKALHAHGLVQTLWGDGPTDGLGAMVGAWWCYEESKRLGISMCELDVMKEIETYNEVDCRVMAEALTYLRTNR